MSLPFKENKISLSSLRKILSSALSLCSTPSPFTSSSTSPSRLPSHFCFTFCSSVPQIVFLSSASVSPPTLNQHCIVLLSGSFPLLTSLLFASHIQSTESTKCAVTEPFFFDLLFVFHTDILQRSLTQLAVCADQRVQELQVIHITPVL